MKATILAVIYFFISVEIGFAGTTDTIAYAPFQYSPYDNDTNYVYLSAKLPELIIKGVVFNSTRGALKLDTNNRNVRKIIELNRLGRNGFSTDSLQNLELRRYSDSLHAPILTGSFSHYAYSDAFTILLAVNDYNQISESKNFYFGNLKDFRAGIDSMAKYVDYVLRKPALPRIGILRFNYPDTLSYDFLGAQTGIPAYLNNNGKFNALAVPYFLDTALLPRLFLVNNFKYIITGKVRKQNSYLLDVYPVVYSDDSGSKPFQLSKITITNDLYNRQGAIGVVFNKIQNYLLLGIKNPNFPKPVIIDSLTLALKNKQLDKAEVYASMLEDGTADKSLYAGLIEANKLNYLGALPYYETYIKLNGTDPVVYYYKAIANYALARYDSALNAFGKAVFDEKNAPDIDFYRGSIYYYRGDNRSAITFFTRQLKLNPNDQLRTLTYLGFSYDNLQMWDSAEAIYAKVASVDSQSQWALADFYRRRATTSDIEGKYMDAYSYYKKTLAITPNSQDLEMALRDLISAKGSDSLILADLNKLDQFDSLNNFLSGVSAINLIYSCIAQDVNSKYDSFKLRTGIKIAHHIIQKNIDTSDTKYALAGIGWFRLNNFDSASYYLNHGTNFLKGEGSFYRYYFIQSLMAAGKLNEAAAELDKIKETGILAVQYNWYHATLYYFHVGCLKILQGVNADFELAKVKDTLKNWVAYNKKTDSASAWTLLEDFEFLFFYNWVAKTSKLDQKTVDKLKDFLCPVINQTYDKGAVNCK